LRRSKQIRQQLEDILILLPRGQQDIKEFISKYT
jgi:hypothetical protein